jgi:hypothetical protein
MKYMINGMENNLIKNQTLKISYVYSPIYLIFFNVLCSFFSLDDIIINIISLYVQLSSSLISSLVFFLEAISTFMFFIRSDIISLSLCSPLLHFHIFPNWRVIFSQSHVVLLLVKLLLKDDPI